MSQEVTITTYDFNDVSYQVERIFDQSTTLQDVLLDEIEKQE